MQSSIEQTGDWYMRKEWIRVRDYLYCPRNFLWGDSVHTCVLGCLFQQAFLTALVAGFHYFPSLEFRDKNMKFTHALLMISFKKLQSEHIY